MANGTPHEEVYDRESSRIVGGENRRGLLGARVTCSKVRLAVLYTRSLGSRLEMIAISQ